VIDLLGPRGLGDGLLVRVAAMEWLRRGEEVRVYTYWPELFHDLPVELATGTPYRDGQSDVYGCAACMHCRRPDVVPLSMFTRSCHQCGLQEVPELDLAWTVTNQAPLDRVRRKANGKPILIFQPPKIANGEEQELYNPRAEDFNRWLDGRTDYYRVKVGHPSAAQEFRDAPCELNLFNKTTVKEMLDLATIGDLFFSQVCFIPTLAESLNKRSVCMFTRRQLSAKSNKVRNLTPEVFLHKRHLHEVVYVD
jgi:hypothetical protein